MTKLFTLALTASFGLAVALGAADSATASPQPTPTKSSITFDFAKVKGSTAAAAKVCTCANGFKIKSVNCAAATANTQCANLCNHSNQGTGFCR